MVFYNISKNLVIHFLTWKGMKIEFNVWLLNLFNIALCFHIICFTIYLKTSSYHHNCPNFSPVYICACVYAMSFWCLHHDDTTHTHSIHTSLACTTH